MPKAAVGAICGVVSLLILPAVAAFQIRSIKRRDAALAALDVKAVDVHLAYRCQPSATVGFAETFALT